jgi:hypothetical protein
LYQSAEIHLFWLPVMIAKWRVKLGFLNVFVDKQNHKTIKIIACVLYAETMYDKPKILHTNYSEVTCHVIS